MILYTSYDCKESDYLWKIKTKLIKPILDDLSEDYNLDKIKENKDKLLNFFKENDETYPKIDTISCSILWYILLRKIFALINY